MIRRRESTINRSGNIFKHSQSTFTNMRIGEQGQPVDLRKSIINDSPLCNLRAGTNTGEHSKHSIINIYNFMPGQSVLISTCQDRYAL
jgi:hypothetical protein